MRDDLTAQYDMIFTYAYNDPKDKTLITAMQMQHQIYDMRKDI